MALTNLSLFTLSLIQHFYTTPPPPAPKAPLERKDIVEGITIPPIHPVIPRGTSAPFWITTGTSPFLFSTSFPWFNIPGKKVNLFSLLTYFN